MQVSADSRREGAGSSWQVSGEESVVMLWDLGFQIGSSDSASSWQKSIGLPFPRASTLSWALPRSGRREAWCSALALGPAPRKQQGTQAALAPFQRLASDAYQWAFV